MSTLDLRPGLLDITAYPGNDVSLSLVFPDDLAGRTFTAEIEGGPSFTASASGTTLTLSLTGDETEQVTKRSRWTLVENGNDLIVGTWRPSTKGTTAPDDDTVVLVGDVTVNVTVIGASGVTQADLDVVEASLAAVAANTPPRKGWDGSGYVWQGTAPTGFTNIRFVGPDDPRTATGGRDVVGDEWVDTSI